MGIVLLVSILGFGITMINNLSHEIELKDKEYEDLRIKYNNLVNDYNNLFENPILIILDLNKNNN